MNIHCSVPKTKVEFDSCRLGLVAHGSVVGLIEIDKEYVSYIGLNGPNKNVEYRCVRYSHLSRPFLAFYKVEAVALYRICSSVASLRVRV